MFKHALLHDHLKITVSSCSSNKNFRTSIRQFHDFEYDHDEVRCEVQYILLFLVYVSTE